MPKKAKKAAKAAKTAKGRPIGGKPKGKANGKPKNNASERNSRTETFRGKKLKNIMTGERRGALGNDLRFHPVEFVRADEFTLSMEKTSTPAPAAPQPVATSESDGETNADVADGIVDSIAGGVSESDIDDEVADSVAGGIVDSIAEAQFSDASVEDEIADSVADSIADNIADVDISEDADADVNADAEADVDADADVEESGTDSGIDSDAVPGTLGADSTIGTSDSAIGTPAIGTPAIGAAGSAIGAAAIGAAIGTAIGTADADEASFEVANALTEDADAEAEAVDGDVDSVAAGSADLRGSIDMDVDPQDAEPVQAELSNAEHDMLLGSESDGELDDLIRLQAIADRSDSEHSDSEHYVPKITLDDYEDYSDVDMSDHMSELDDEQIFALASGSSVFQHEDRDVFDKYDEYDEYFDELIGGGSKPMVSDRKKLKRQAREALHAVQFGKTPALWREYPEFITVHEVLDELRKFAMQKSVQQLAFPPLDSNANWYVSSLATQHGMTAVTEGKMDVKYIRVSRTNRTTAHVPDHKLRKFLTRRKTFTRTDTPEVKKVRSKVVKGEKAPSARVRDGHVVGHDATEIGDSNFGHRLLRQMGWQEGSGLGKERAGIVAPIPATVKLSKVGLGG